MIIGLVAIFLSCAAYALGAFLHWYVMKARRIIKMTDHLESPGRHWFWGTFHMIPEMSEVLFAWIKDQQHRYGDIFKIWVGPLIPRVVICHPDLAKQILRTAEPKSMSVTNYGAFEPCLGMGVFMSGGATWQRKRHLLTPAFHFGMLKTYLKVKNKTAGDMLNILDKFAKRGESFDIFRPASLFSLDTVLQCVFSYQSNVQYEGESLPIVRLANRVMQLGLERMRSPYFWPDFLFYLSSTGREFTKVCKEYHSISKRIIKARKIALQNEAMDGQQEGAKDFLDILFRARDENGIGMVEEEIEAEVNNILFAGHDTSTSVISWTLYALATHPYHQATCREEIRNILQNRVPDEINFDDLPKMSYLTMVIKETMRLFTTVPFISRCLTRDIDVNGHVIPKGCDVLLVLHAIHNHPGVWPEPEKFKPERFHPNTAVGRNSFNFVPFSAGPRNCIAQNFAMNVLKVVLARIINRFHIGYDTKHHVEKLPEVTLKAKNGLWLTLKRLCQ